VSAGGLLSIEYQARLVEEAVLLAMRGRPRTAYWDERDEVYRIDDAEERDRRFTQLCRKQFEALGLSEPIDQALREQPIVSREVKAGWVVPALSRKDEGAELLVSSNGAMPAADARSLVLKLRPGSFSRPEELLTLLRHEIFHIADMVDPAFGYDPAPPEVEGGAVRLKLALNRYRVLWDTVIDGRLMRAGRAAEGAREARAAEFAPAFSMLGDPGREEFDRWFASEHPAHADLLGYALDPAAAAGLPVPEAVSIGICLLCQSPGALLFPGGGSVPPEVVEEVTSDFPRWRSADGLCRQCEDVYRARPLSREAARLLPSG
jgi:hypothetical protein